MFALPIHQKVALSIYRYLFLLVHLKVGDRSRVQSELVTNHRYWLTDWLTDLLTEDPLVFADNQSLPWIITSTDPSRNSSLRLPLEVSHCLWGEGVFQARRWRAGSPEVWDSPKSLLVSHSWSMSNSMGSDKQVQVQRNQSYRTEGIFLDSQIPTPLFET